MSRGGLALALLLAACQPQDARNEGAPANAVLAPRPAPPKASAPVAEPAPAAPDPAALEGLTAFQRRAYEKGFEDCRAGRYQPDRWPEAYRIGCAAAHDARAG
jgi:hypothetical protein